MIQVSMPEMGFQIISCPICGAPTAITLPYEEAAFIVSELPYIEVNPDAYPHEVDERIACPEGHAFYVYAF